MSKLGLDMIQIGLYRGETYVHTMHVCVPTVSLVNKLVPIDAILTKIEFIA